MRSQILELLLTAGPLGVQQLRAKLRVRRQRLFPVLAKLVAEGVVFKGSQCHVGTDGRPRLFTVYGAALGSSGDGSRRLDGGSPSLTADTINRDSQETRRCSWCSAPVASDPAAEAPVICGSCRDQYVARHEDAELNRLHAEAELEADRLACPQCGPAYSKWRDIVTASGHTDACPGRRSTEAADVDASGAAADLEFSEPPSDCPGCSTPGYGPGFCSRCEGRRA